jgi:Holliday junction resolvasome RuvABC DNA-binding subunit
MTDATPTLDGHLALADTELREKQTVVVYEIFSGYKTDQKDSVEIAAHRTVLALVVLGWTKREAEIAVGDALITYAGKKFIS